MRARTQLKALLEPWIVESGLARGALRRVAGRTVVLAYHNIVPRGEAGEGDAALHMPQARFAEQLDALCDTHEVVALASLLDATANPDGPEGRPRAAVTFDDAYRGSVTAGVEELARRGLPATVFVSPGLLGGTAFWWDVLAKRRPDGLDPRVRRWLLKEMAGRQDAVMEWVRAHGPLEGAVPSHMRAADEADLRRAVSHDGIALGAHGWSHSNLTRLGPAELEEELLRPLAWLRDRFPSACTPWLAYPYGLTSAHVARAASGAGYQGAVLVGGGWVPQRRMDQHRVPRLNVAAGVSRPGFVLRISGLVR